MRLLRVELARLASRRSVLVVALLGLVGTLLFGYQAFATSQPLSPEEEARAQQQYELAQQDWEENGEQYVAECREAEEQEEELTGEEADYGCDDQEPQRDWFFLTAPELEQYLQFSVLPLAMLSLLLLTLGVSAVAAEFSSGTMSTWLTFVPRRGRVLASRLGALALVGLVYGALWWAAMLGLSALAFGINGAVNTLTAELLQQVPRAGLLAMAVAVVGGALGFLLRHTAAALGVAAGLMIALDAVLLGSVLEHGPRWQLTTNAFAWVNGYATYTTQECTSDAGGTVCEVIDHFVWMEQGGLVLLGVMALAVALAWVTFRRREVR